MRAIDLFAGAGGFTTAAGMAGVRVVWAANHWREAVEVHASNHPEVEHVCQDLQQADWARVPAHDLLLASPACQGHSRARGADKPHHDVTRSTAWAVVACAEFHRPAALVVENVPEFARWTLYRVWWRALTTLGYRLAACVMDAADAGVPQNRQRLFVVGSLSRLPVIRPPALAHVPASAVVDFGAGDWSPVARSGRAASTLARVHNGRREFGRRFLVAYYGSEDGGRDLARPLGTVTTRDRWALIDGDRMRMLRVDELRAAMGFPATYRLPSSHKAAVHMLGNAVCPPVAAHAIRCAKDAA